MVNDLIWEAVIEYDANDQERDWISIGGKTTDITGIGDSNVVIEIKDAKKSSSKLSAHVSFHYYYVDGTEVDDSPITIEVCRCFGCGCDNFDVLDVTTGCTCENVVIKPVNI